MLDILIRNKARETPGIIQDLAEFAEMRHFYLDPVESVSTAVYLQRHWMAEEACLHIYIYMYECIYIYASTHM